MNNSLERIIPDYLAAGETTGMESLLLHMERYRFAGQNLVPGSIADVACGVGYGSYLLATEFPASISSITAVDIDQESIAYARSRYAHPLIHFIQGSALQIKTEKPWNNIVSLETIEHLPDAAGFVAKMSSLLAPGGHFIASVPITPSMDANPFHLHDFTRSSFVKMFESCGLKIIHSMLQVQRYHPLRAAGRKEERGRHIRRNILQYYLKHPGKCWLRVRSLLTDGFRNKYLVAVFQKPVVDV